MEYTIKQGDTLSQIAKLNNTTVEAIAKANQIADPNKIIAGNVLKLPEIQPTGVDVSASEITTGIPEIPQAIPELEKDTTANAILAYTTGEQLKTAEERKKLEETAQKTLGTTDLITAYQNRPTIDLATIRTQQLESTGATALREDVAQQSLKLAEIKGERDRLDIMEQNEIDALTKAGVTRGAIERETTTIQRKYASKKAKLSADLNAEASMLAAMQGNYTMAKEAADQAVQDYVFDYQQKVDTFNNVFNTYSDLISDLNQEEKEILKTAATEAQKELDKVTKEKKDVMALRLQYAGAGISINDSLEQAIAKAEKIAGSDAKLNRQLKEAQLAKAQDTTDTETQLATLYAQAQTLASSKGVSTIEAIASLPVSQDLKTNLLFFNSFTEQLEQTAKQEQENRVNVEEVTPALIQELFDLGYDLPTIKAMAKDETVLANIEKAYKELSTQKNKENLSVAGSAIGSTAKGIVDFFTDTPEEIKEIEKTLKESTGESWKFNEIINAYVSDSGKTKSKHQLFTENIWKGLSENIISPFLKGVSESFED